MKNYGILIKKKCVVKKGALETNGLMVVYNQENYPENCTKFVREAMLQNIGEQRLVKAKVR